MSGIVQQRQTAVGNYFLPRQPSQTSQISSGSPWTSDDESPLERSYSSTETYATSPTESPYLDCIDPLNTASKDQFSGDVFSFGDFDDWMQWDEPLVVSPSPEPQLRSPIVKAEPTSPNMNMNGARRSSANARPMFSSSVNPMAISRSMNLPQDAIREEPLFQNPSLQTSSTDAKSPLTNLYSTPLAWDRPQSGLVNGMSLNFPRLSAAEEQKLRQIAMNTSSEDFPPSPVSDSSVEHHEDRKRKCSIDEDEDDSDSGCAPPARRSRQAPKRTAHNMIEKRYRTNLNDKIAALRDSVPSLRAVTKKDARGEDMEEDLEGLSPAHKLNKATVLSKATEYIAHLEKRNKSLNKENQVLRSRIEAFEILLMSRTARSDRAVPQMTQNPRYA